MRSRAAISHFSANRSESLHDFEKRNNTTPPRGRKSDLLPSQNHGYDEDSHRPKGEDRTPPVVEYGLKRLKSTRSTAWEMNIGHASWLYYPPELPMLHAPVQFGVMMHRKMRPANALNAPKIVVSDHPRPGPV